MNNNNSQNTSKIVLSVGDESGVGPEIILKALYSHEIPKNIDFILVGSKKNLQNTYSHLKTIGLENLANPNNFIPLFFSFHVTKASLSQSFSS